LVIIPTQFLPGAAVARHHCRMGAGGWHWNDAWIFVSAVIAERLERDRALHAALPVTGASLADVLAASVFHFGDLTIGEVKDSLRAAGNQVR